VRKVYRAALIVRQLYPDLQVFPVPDLQAAPNLVLLVVLVDVAPNWRQISTTHREDPGPDLRPAPDFYFLIWMLVSAVDFA